MVIRSKRAQRKMAHRPSAALTVHGLDLSGWLLLLPPHAALSNALDFPPEVLHGHAVYGGLWGGAAECRRVEGFIGQHPVNPSATRNWFSGGKNNIHEWKSVSLCQRPKNTENHRIKILTQWRKVSAKDRDLEALLLYTLFFTTTLCPYKN